MKKYQGESSVSMKMFLNRIKKEIKDIIDEPFEGIRLHPGEDDMRNWSGEIDGPEGTAYYGYVLKLNIKLTENYPLEAPKIFFKHPVFHPNISSSGHICLDILQNQWAPTLTLKKVMLSISSLLNDPNPSSPLNGTAANLWINNREVYNSNVITTCNAHCTKKI